MKTRAAVILLIFMTSFLHALDSSSFLTAVPSEVKQGGLLPVVLKSRVSGYTGKFSWSLLSSNTGKITRKGLFYPAANLYWKSYVPFSVKDQPGYYYLIIKTFGIDFPNGRDIAISVIELKINNFPTEEIHLDKQQTSLRRDPTPAKTNEAKELTDLLDSANPANNQSEIILSFILPVESGSYHISSNFGDRRSYIYSDGTSAFTYHYGKDFAAPTGKNVFASAKGTVVFSKFREVTGNTIVIEHFPGLYTLYFHMDSRIKQLGEKVVGGDLIGFIGSTGLSTGPHLHFEVRCGSLAVSPDVLFLLNETISSSLIKLK